MSRAQIFKVYDGSYSTLNGHPSLDVLTAYVQEHWSSLIKRGDIVDCNNGYEEDLFNLDKFIWDGEKVVELECNDFFDEKRFPPSSFICDDIKSMSENTIKISSSLYWENALNETGIIWFSERVRREVADKLKRSAFGEESSDDEEDIDEDAEPGKIADRFFSSFMMNGKRYPFFIDMSYYRRFSQKVRLSLKKAKELIMNMNIPFDISCDEGEYRYTLAMPGATQEECLKTAVGVMDEIEQEKKTSLFMEDRDADRIQARKNYKEDVHTPVIIKA
jgi:hypothetical protein